MALQIKKNNRENSQKLKALEEAVKGEDVRMTINLKKSIYKELRLLCALSDKKITIKDVVTEALEEYLNKYSNIRNI